MRATRMSVVDFWKNETKGDGLNIRVAHGVNSWPDLVDQLHEPFLNKSMMIEGDVFMQAHRRPRHRAVPVMKAEAKVADRITFKEWLREVATMHKAIKINFRSNEVVRPVLQDLYASQADPSSPILQYPVILHANVFRSPRSVEAEVDPHTFVEKAKTLFPDATLSLGWTKQANFSHLHPKFKKLSWRQLFHILEYISPLDQPVMLSVRLSVAAHSKEQLLWLLGMDQSISLLLWSDRDDKINNWESIIELRRSTTKNRILYDLDPKHRKMLQNISNEPIENPKTFSLQDWRAVEFTSSSPVLSTVVRSERGPAFLGEPTSLLLSQIPPPKFPNKQTVNGKVHFLPKRIVTDIDVDESGVSIFLMDRIHDIDSPKIERSVEVFIGYDGKVKIENGELRNQASFDSKSVGQLPISECYAFEVTDLGNRVISDVWTVECGEKFRKKRHLKLELETPFIKNRFLRNVVVAKKGDGAIDFLLEELQHNGSLSSSEMLSTISTILLILGLSITSGEALFGFFESKKMTSAATTTTKSPLGSEVIIGKHSHKDTDGAMVTIPLNFPPTTLSTQRPFHNTVFTRRPSAGDTDFENKHPTNDSRSFTTTTKGPRFTAATKILPSSDRQGCPNRIDAYTFGPNDNYAFSDRTVYIIRKDRIAETKNVDELFERAPRKINGALFDIEREVMWMIANREVYGYKWRDDKWIMQSVFPKELPSSVGFTPEAAIRWHNKHQVLISNGGKFALYDELWNKSLLSGRTQSYFENLPDRVRGISEWRNGRANVFTQSLVFEYVIDQKNIVGDGKPLAEFWKC
ncbi:unnamed protein product [Caenorhabditis bovis]|uniref:Uncharacterized protein n=1 Tax=Caenorhabditis bovis TaxID=2654633 RepID=A0A8S1E3S5_9PELO|nr:unnamed protein product [Caenorhabditis bovis]